MTMMRTKFDPTKVQAQAELALASMLSNALFPGRKTLYAKEVAVALGCTIQHVFGLICEGKLKAVDIGGGLIKGGGGGNASDRKAWRIPVSAYDQFVKDNQS